MTRVELGLPELGRPFVAVVDPPTREWPAARAMLAGATAVHEVVGRPTPADADAIRELVRRTGADALLSTGAGLVVDAAKLAVFDHQAETGVLLDHVAVPCGPEPYRAVTPFTMYDAVPGLRHGRQEEWLRPRVAALVPELLAEMPEATVALFAGDSAVHAFESLLSRLTTDASAALAADAATILAAPSAGVVELARASILAAEAFDTTKLGLAHALSRPLGIAAGVSHDAYNLMLGVPVARFWGDAVIRETAAGSALPELDVDRWADVFDGYRRRAGLPASLGEMPLRWSDVEAALAWAPNSSGIPNLPRPLADGDLEKLMTEAWGLRTAASMPAGRGPSCDVCGGEG